MTPLEKAARAAANAALGRDDQWEMHSHIARAVLMAVREPDEAMLRAGRFRPYDKAYSAMIGAILNEKSE